MAIHQAGSLLLKGRACPSCWSWPQIHLMTPGGRRVGTVSQTSPPNYFIENTDNPMTIHPVQNHPKSAKNYDHIFINFISSQPGLHKLSTGEDQQQKPTCPFSKMNVRSSTNQQAPVYLFGSVHNDRVLSRYNIRLNNFMEILLEGQHFQMRPFLCCVWEVPAS